MSQVTYLGKTRYYGVFLWTKENRYPERDAVKVYKTARGAQGYADKLNESYVLPYGGYVVRTVWKKEVDTDEDNGRCHLDPNVLAGFAL